MWNVGSIRWATGKFDPKDLKEEFKLKSLTYTEYQLTWEQKMLLRKYGTKMQALMDGKIFPFSPKGRHFVDMCNGLVEPSDECEHIWKSYLSTLDEEKRLKTEWVEQRTNSPEYEEYFKSRCFADGNCAEDIRTNGTAPESFESKEMRGRKCSVCQGAMEDCWKCGGRGWI